MLIHVVHGNAMGGAQRYALDICRHYVEAGEEVIALTRDAKTIDSQFEESGIPLCHAPLRDYPDLFSALTLSRIMRKSGEGRIVVHTHRYRDALTAVMARRMAGRSDIRIVITRHIAEPAKDNPLRRLIYRNVDAHIFGSEFARREFLNRWPSGRYPFDPARMYVAFDSRNISIEPTAEPSRGAITAMYHGKLHPGKGLMTLIDAMSLLKDTRLRLKIAGQPDSDFADALRRHAIASGVMESIDWIRDSADPARYIETSHFGVLPSEEPESCGMANIEYMASARPQICTFNSAQGEYMTPGVEAIEVKPGDSAGLARGMRLLYEDKDLRIRMGIAARKRYEELLAWPRFIAVIDKIYTLH